MLHSAIVATLGKYRKTACRRCPGQLGVLRAQLARSSRNYSYFGSLAQRVFGGWLWDACEGSWVLCLRGGNGNTAANILAALPRRSRVLRAFERAAGLSSSCAQRASIAGRARIAEARIAATIKVFWRLVSASIARWRCCPWHIQETQLLQSDQPRVTACGEWLVAEASFPVAMECLHRVV
jgi:hypothetical protein